MTMMSIANEHAASLSETMSIIHDLRNPLSTIHGGAELLAGSALSDVQVRRLAQNLYKASLRMNELLEECLCRHRRSDETAQPCDLRELVKEAVDEVHMRAQFQSVQIADSLQEELMIVGDRRRIRRVFVNLLVNSLDVMPGGGRIVISAATQGQTVLTKVSDTGPGISPQIRGQLFQPFATAGKANGLGLGLASSRRALIDEGGNLWAEKTSQGACFVVCLPRAPRNSAADVSRATQYDAPD